MEQNLIKFIHSIATDNLALIIDQEQATYDIITGLSFIYAGQKALNVLVHEKSIDLKHINERRGMTERFSKCVLDNYNLCDDAEYFESMNNHYDKLYTNHVTIF